MTKCRAIKNGKFAPDCRTNISFSKGDVLENLTDKQVDRLVELGFAEKIKQTKPTKPAKEKKVVSEKETKVIDKEETKIVE